MNLNQPERPEIVKFGTHRKARVWVQIAKSRSVLVGLGPNCPITVHFGQFGSKLSNHGSFWSVWVQIVQSRSVLVGLGLNCPITVRFGRCVTDRSGWLRFIITKQVSCYSPLFCDFLRQKKNRKLAL